MKKVAIFDIDGTIFRSSLLIELVNVLIDRRIFPETTRLEFGREYLVWLDRKGSYEDYIMAVVNVFMKYIKGVKYDELKSASELVIAQQANRTYRYTRDLIVRLRLEGYYILSISHSPKIILEEFTKAHGFDKVYGMRYEMDENNRFTGEIMDRELIFDKAKILERAIEKENLTLEDSVGVGDTEGDITFLSMVKNPICFNPNENLYKYAQKAGWKVVVERKDVIYEL